LSKFQKGQPKPQGSGRKAGTPNKKTELLLDIFEAKEYCPAEKAIELLISGKIDPEKELDAHLKLMEFKFPKRKAVEHSGPNDGPLETETYEQYVARLKQEANV
jgi:hypothetical protein